MEPDVLLPDEDLVLLMKLAGWEFPMPRQGMLDMRYLRDPKGTHYCVQRMPRESRTQSAFKQFLRSTSGT